MSDDVRMVKVTTLRKAYFRVTSFREWVEEGVTVEVREDVAREELALGTVKLAKGVKLDDVDPAAVAEEAAEQAAPDDDAKGVDTPLEELDKDELLARLEALGDDAPAFDKRWGVKKLAEALDGATADS